MYKADILNKQLLAYLSHFHLFSLLPRDARTMRIARYCYRKSSVCPSVTLRYRSRISWVTSKIITRIISLVSSLLGDPTSAI